MPGKITATELMEERREEYARLRYEGMMERFVRRFAPTADPRENARFQAELSCITRQLFMDALRQCQPTFTPAREAPSLGPGKSSPLQR